MMSEGLEEVRHWLGTIFGVESAEARKRKKKKNKKNKKKKRKKNKNKNRNRSVDTSPGPGTTNPGVSNPPPEPTEPPSNPSRVRRSIFALSQADYLRLTDAFNTLKERGDYDGFVQRHFEAMDVAHRGPIFLPWHRAYLEEIEGALLAVDPAIAAMPYWPWEMNDGIGSLWADSGFGPNGDPGNGNRVLSGPFADWHALIFNASTGALEPRATVGLVRRLGQGAGNLPSAANVEALYSSGQYAQYDAAPWNTSVDTMRNRLEGFVDGPVLHNRVHVWIGGDMSASTSPNDPVFWLHHANVDRIWWNWQLRRGIDNFQSPGSPNSPMPRLLSSVSPADVFDIRARGYSYE